MPRGGRGGRGSGRGRGGGGRGRGRGHSDKLKKPKDPHKPKTNPSSYFLFNNEVRASFREKYPDKKPSERAKLVAAKWKEMRDEKKKPYSDKAAILRNEYRTKMVKYKHTQNYMDHQQRLKEWKQQCIDMSVSNGDIDSDSNSNNKNKKNLRQDNWKEFKERRQNENEKESENEGTCTNVNEWNWYSIIKWLNRIEQGRFKNVKYSTIKKIWKESKIKGYELFALNDFVLRMGGMTDNEDRKIVLKHILGLSEDRNDRLENGNEKRVTSILECDIPNEMCCPISYEIMADPVLCVVSGHSYEREVIEEYINDKHQDPLTRQEVTMDKLVPNRALRDIIESWKSKHDIQE